MNNVQTGVVGLCRGTYSHAALVCDGTGGNVVTPTNGAVTVSASAGGTSIPTPTITKGVFYKEMAPLAAGAVRWNSGPTTYTLDWGFGVGGSSLFRAGTGECAITLSPGASSVTSAVALVTVNRTPAVPPLDPTYNATISAGGGELDVILYASSTLTDYSFYFVVWGS